MELRKTASYSTYTQVDDNVLKTEKLSLHNTGVQMKQVFDPEMCSAWAVFEMTVSNNTQKQVKCQSEF